MTKKNFGFDLGVNPTLTLTGLFAQVAVKKGPAGKASVEITGEEKLLDLIQVTQPNSNEVLVVGQEIDGDNITIIQNGGRGASVSIKSSHGSVVCGSITGTCIVGEGSVVIIDGHVISGGENVTQINAPELPVIMITVPEGTYLEAVSVTSLFAQDLNGNINLSLGDRDEANIQDVVGAKIRASDRSAIKLWNVTGNLNVSCSDRASFQAKGNFGDIEAKAKDRSAVQINGNCHDVDVSASDRATFSLNGNVSGKTRQRERDRATVNIG